MNRFKYQEKVKKYPGLPKAVFKALRMAIMTLAWGDQKEERVEFITVKRLSPDELLNSFQLMDPRQMVCGDYRKPSLWLCHKWVLLSGRLVASRVTRIQSFRSERQRSKGTSGKVDPAKCMNLATKIDRKGLAERADYLLEIHPFGTTAAVRVLLFPEAGVQKIIEEYKQAFSQ